MNLVAQVTQRLNMVTTRTSSERNIDRAMELNDRYSGVKPQEYVVPIAKRPPQRPISK